MLVRNKISHCDLYKLGYTRTTMVITRVKKIYFINIFKYYLKFGLYTVTCIY